MQRARLSAASAAVLTLAALLSACSTKPVDKTAGWSPNRIHAEAKDELNSGAWDKAIPLYETLEGRAAGTPLAQQAQLDKAYAQFKDGQKAEAIATLDRFMRLHPSSPAVDYALYLKGVINFNDELGLLRQRRAGGAALQGLEQRHRLVVGAVVELVLGLGVDAVGTPARGLVDGLGRAGRQQAGCHHGCCRRRR